MTLVGSIGNLLLVVFKFIAGILGNSAAMIADAVHSLSDFITDVIVIIFVGISAKPQDESHDYVMESLRRWLLSSWPWHY